MKTAAVEVLAREKLGGGYITVVIKGDVAAVRAAVEAGSAKVDGLGRLIASHVIPSRSRAVPSQLPKAKGPALLGATVASHGGPCARNAMPEPDGLDEPARKRGARYGTTNCPVEGTDV